MLGPLLASVDAQDDAISLYAWRDGGFVRVGSLTTGPLPAQIIAADLNGNGCDDLVVRNAGDGTLSVFFSNGTRQLADRLRPAIPAAVTIPWDWASPTSRRSTPPATAVSTWWSPTS